MEQMRARTRSGSPPTRACSSTSRNLGCDTRAAARHAGTSSTCPNGSARTPLRGRSSARAGMPACRRREDIWLVVAGAVPRLDERSSARHAPRLASLASAYDGAYDGWEAAATDARSRSPPRRESPPRGCSPARRVAPRAPRGSRSAAPTTSTRVRRRPSSSQVRLFRQPSTPMRWPLPRYSAQSSAWRSHAVHRRRSPRRRRGRRGRPRAGSSPPSCPRRRPAARPLWRGCR